MNCIKTEYLGCRVLLPTYGHDYHLQRKCVGHSIISSFFLYHFVVFDTFVQIPIFRQSILASNTSPQSAIPPSSHYTVNKMIIFKQKVLVANINLFVKCVCACLTDARILINVGLCFSPENIIYNIFLFRLSISDRNYIYIKKTLTRLQ